MTLNIGKYGINYSRSHFFNDCYGGGVMKAFAAVICISFIFSIMILSANEAAYDFTGTWVPDRGKSDKKSKQSFSLLPNADNSEEKGNITMSASLNQACLPDDFPLNVYWPIHIEQTPESMIIKREIPLESTEVMKHSGETVMQYDLVRKETIYETVMETCRKRTIKIRTNIVLDKNTFQIRTIADWQNSPSITRKFKLSKDSKTLTYEVMNDSGYMQRNQKIVFTRQESPNK
jgi:hypothetical protein